MKIGSIPLLLSFYYCIMFEAKSLNDESSVKAYKHMINGIYAIREYLKVRQTTAAEYREIQTECFYPTDIMLQSAFSQKKWKQKSLKYNKKFIKLKTETSHTLALSQNACRDDYPGA